MMFAKQLREGVQRGRIRCSIRVWTRPHVKMGGRYKMDDGLPGIEGGLQICTFWLVEALAVCGRVQEARALFDAAVELSGPTGILTEEYEPDLKLSLGNFPQAYSHLGLINAAVRLSQAPPA